MGGVHFGAVKLEYLCKSYSNIPFRFFGNMFSIHFTKKALNVNILCSNK
jgi:hypothetical protein